jgi:hypothetical protein
VAMGVSVGANRPSRGCTGWATPAPILRRYQDVVPRAHARRGGPDGSAPRRRGSVMKLGVGLFLLAVVATSCSDYRDVVVFNPCPEPAQVSFSGSERSADSESCWFGAASIPREQAVTLEDRLGDVGEPAWARITFVGLDPRVEEIPVPFPADDAPVLLLIPARSCPLRASDGPQ